MISVEEKLASSLTAESVELIPFLPYLLQDLWELGSSPKDIIRLIETHVDVTSNTRILDLACGKGAVSIALAKKFHCQVMGIDILHDFVVYAREKAVEHGVVAHCQFLQEDINLSIERNYNVDIVILGAVGDVLGSYEETLRKLLKTVRTGGYIIIDDGYAIEQGNDGCITKQEWEKLFKHLNIQFITDLPIALDDLVELNNEQQQHIITRANELKQQYPEKTALFDGYIQSQIEECQELETSIQGVTMLLQKME